MALSRIDSPLRLTVAYGVFGTAWILVTDGLVAWEGGIGTKEWILESSKGLFFIGITASLLYLLTKRLVARHLQAEVALREAQLRWQFALEGAGGGLWDWNVPTGQVFYSKMWKSILGYAEDEIGGTLAEWETRVHPEDRARVKTELNRHLEGKAPRYVCEHRLRTKDGSYKWVLDRGQVVGHTAEGRPLRMLGMHTDISERKSAEARMADTLAFDMAMLHSSPVGVIAYGPDGEAVTANTAAARIVGTTVPGLLRQNFRKLESWRQHGLLAAAEQSLASGKEVVLRGPLQTTFGRALWVEARFVPFVYQEAKHLLLLISDETEQHQASENLSLLNAAVQAATSGWVITDAEGVIQFVNPGFTAMTGYTPEEAVGRKISILKSGRQGAAFYAAMWETIRRGEVWHGELENCRKDGTFYQEQMTISPVRDPQGRIAHYVAVKHDISEQKKLEQQITRTQRLESIGLLASGIAHDLNNILAPITLALELLKIKYPAGEAVKMLELIENSAQRGAGIVRQVLTFARGVDGARVQVQPRHLLKDIGRLIEETFPRNIESELDIAPDVQPILGDVTQLHQVLLNLAVNARDAMPEGGVLRLRAHNVTLERLRESGAVLLRPGRYVALVVADTGTGIKPEIVERMFEPFFTTKPQGKGTGLGLSTVHGIVRSHGGLVEVQTRLGEGTEFCVLLPAVEVPASAAGSRSPLPAPIAGTGRTVLVVDDEEAIRLVTAGTLERHGFVVETARDGVEALEKYRGRPGHFAAVLTDVMMPHMNGYQLAGEIRRTDPHVPILASTGVTGEGAADGTDSKVLAQLGIRTRLIKPYTEHQLLRALAAELTPRDGQKKG